MTKRAFGDLELAVLHILKKGKRMTVKEVLEQLGGTNKYTTIMTVMNRLYEKGALDREKEGHHYEYWPVEAEKSLGEKVKKKLFGMKPAEMISYLIDSSEDLSEEEIQKIEGMIADLKSKKK